jgi:hypothetical protein
MGVTHTGESHPPSCNGQAVCSSNTCASALLPDLPLPSTFSGSNGSNELTIAGIRFDGAKKSAYVPSPVGRL